MDSISPERHSSASPQPRRLSLNLLLSISSLVALCAKHANQVSNKLKRGKPTHYHHQNGKRSSPKLLLVPKSPLATPKHLLTQMSNKAIALIHKNKRVGEENDDVLVGPEDFGDGGVWQKAILMGGKCQPLDFSGAIYYDSDGKQLDEVPLRSPRASPLPAYLSREK